MQAAAEFAQAAQSERAKQRRASLRGQQPGDYDSKSRATDRPSLFQWLAREIGG
jgi:hypothetical protein